MTKAELAKQNFLNGCNCAQAVLLAFSDETGLDRATALRLASGLGGGMARMREVCGTVNGMFLAAGLILGSDDTADRAAKSELYRRLQELAERFRARNGSIVCRELLAGVKTTPGGVPEARTDTYYKKRPCAELCADAAKILEEFLQAYPEARAKI